MDLFSYHGTRQVGEIFLCDRCTYNPCLVLGGTISIVTREEHLHTVDDYKDKLEPLMQQLEKEGKWKQIKRDIFKGFFLDKEGILWKYQVC